MFEYYILSVPRINKGPFLLWGNKDEKKTMIDFKEKKEGKKKKK